MKQTSNKTATPTRKPRKYRNDFLKKVIARIDFAEPIELPKRGPPDPVVKEFKKRFPIAERKTRIRKQVTVHLSGEPEERQTEIREWHYYSKSRHKKLVLTNQAMLIEYTRYNTFQTLQQDFLSTSGKLFETFESLQVRRLGLRYIDHIELDEPNPTDWLPYLSQDLLSIFRLSKNRQAIARAFHVLELAYDDESRLCFQYGMPNPDFPARIKRKFFTLDWDLYCNLLLERQEVARFLVLFHDRARDAFEEMITDELRQKMGAVYE